MMGKSVCFLVSEHPFLDARIFKKEAKSLVKEGYQVTMIVPRRNGYLFDVDGTIFREKFRKKQFTHEGIKIITYEQLFPERKIKHLYTNLLSAGSKRFKDRLTQLGIAEKADIYHAHEFLSLYSGIGIKRTLSAMGKNAKLIYDSHELDPDPYEKQASRIKKIKRESLQLMLKETDHVITVSKSIQSSFKSMNRELPATVIFNSPRLTPECKPGQGINKELTLVYEGVMNETRGSFHKLMQITEKCNETFPLKVIIIGGSKKPDNPLKIPPHLKDKIKQTGWVDYESVSEAMQGADLGWIDLDAGHLLNHRFAMPNKFFSYLNNGIPVLVNQCKDMEEFIRKYNCGYIVEGFQPTAEDYVQALLYLNSNRGKLPEMSRNARKIMETDYSWDHMEKRLLSIYDSLLN